MNQLVPHHVQGHIVQPRQPDGYINATEMCKAVGKLFADYRRSKSARGFLNALSLDMGIPISKLVQTFRGKPVEFQGTWVHPRVAIHLGQWCSPKFAVRVTSIVTDWMQGLPRHKAFESYLLRDPATWQKRFQDSIWPENCRLKNIAFDGDSHHRAQWLGDVVNFIVYDRIGPPDLREEHDNRNPRLESGYRAKKHHQLLVEEIGVDELEKHLHMVTAFMRATNDGEWGDFCMRLDRASPRHGGMYYPPPPPRNRKTPPKQLSLPFH